jgi:tetratricopeptide (TPR) repeat protein
MTPYVAVLFLVFCLAFPVYTPEAQEGAGSESQDANQNLTTLADKQHALAAHLKSARELRQANDLLKAAQHLNEAGQLQLKLNLPDEALNTFHDSLALAERTGDPVVKVDALRGLSAVHLRSRTYREALPLIQQAIAISEQNNYVQGRAEALSETVTALFVLT